MSTLTWPVQGHNKQQPDGTWVRVPPCRVSDADARRAYAAYAARYGTSQSFERLHERGGFGRGELDHFAPGWTPIEIPTELAKRGWCDRVPVEAAIVAGWIAAAPDEGLPMPPTADEVSP